MFPRLRNSLLLAVFFTGAIAASTGQDPASAASSLRLQQTASVGVHSPTQPSAARTAEPKASAGAESLDELASKAVIRRDRFGVPHILADTEEAAAYAHGYATAEDHGAELARLFLRAQGALASVFGEQFVEQDMRTRTLGIHETAEARFNELPPFMQRILGAYAAGYDFFLLHHRAEFPDWATPVTAVDVLAHCRAVLLLDFSLDLTPWDQAAHAGNGSTMWAIGHSLSKSGHGMLLANPHVPWEGSTVFHELQITVPGVINVSGATFIGLPVVTIGFNESLGWSHTVNEVHADDVYELTLDASHTHYAYDGGWLPLQPRTISVAVRSGSELQTRTRTVLFSHYGPVIRVEDNKAYAFKSASLADVNFLTQYNSMGKASSLHAFLDALNMQQLPMFNVAYADRDGNIWYAFNGRIPIRPTGYNWAGPVPGNTSKTEWFAMRPLDELPQLLNPKTGYVQNCNDAPWYTNLQQQIDPGPYADYIGQTGGSLGWRSQESLRILSSEHEFTLDKLKAYKFDSEILIADRLKDELLSLIKTRDNNEQWREATRILKSWDNHADVNSHGATLFFVWWAEYYKLTQKPFKTPWSSDDPIGTPKGISDPTLAVEAFGNAIANLTKRYGKLDVPWGDTHRLRHGNLDLPLNGTPLTLGNLMYRPTPEGKFVAVGGDSFVLAVEFTEAGPQAYTVVPFSESADPKSQHFNDQASLYANKQYKPSWYEERDIAANLSSQYHPDH